MLLITTAITATATRKGWLQAMPSQPKIIGVTLNKIKLVFISLYNCHLVNGLLTEIALSHLTLETDQARTQQFHLRISTYPHQSVELCFQIQHRHLSLSAHPKI